MCFSLVTAPLGQGVGLTALRLCAVRESPPGEQVARRQRRPTPWTPEEQPSRAREAQSRGIALPRPQPSHFHCRHTIQTSRILANGCSGQVGKRHLNLKNPPIEDFFFNATFSGVLSLIKVELTLPPILKRSVTASINDFWWHWMKGFKLSLQKFSLVNAVNKYLCSVLLALGTGGLTQGEQHTQEWRTYLLTGILPFVLVINANFIQLENNSNNIVSMFLRRNTLNPGNNFTRSFIQTKPISSENQRQLYTVGWIYGCQI